jgi:hypothetical protein
VEENFHVTFAHTMFSHYGQKSSSLFGKECSLAGQAYLVGETRRRDVHA